MKLLIVLDNLWIVAWVAGIIWLLTQGTDGGPYRDAFQHMLSHHITTVGLRYYYYYVYLSRSKTLANHQTFHQVTLFSFLLALVADAYHLLNVILFVSSSIHPGAWVLCIVMNSVALFVSVATIMWFVYVLCTRK